MRFLSCGRKSRPKQSTKTKKKVRIAETVKTLRSSDSQDTLPTHIYKSRDIELKITMTSSHRRVVVHEKLSYNGLIRMIKKLFRETGKVRLYYQDEEGDIVNMGCSIEVRAMLLMAKRRLGHTRLFVKKG